MKKFQISFIIIALLLSMPAFCLAEEYQSFISTGKLKGVVQTQRPELVNPEWWESYNDPKLSGYISEAVSKNHDIKIASLKILEYESLSRVMFANQLPTLDLGGTLQNKRTSGNMPMGSMNPGSYTQSTFLFPLTANYELDLWGKNRLNTQASKKETQTMIFDEKAVYISIVSSVATSYFNLAMTDKLIDIQKNIISQKEDKLSLFNAKYAQGLISYDEINQVQESIQENKAELAELQKQQNLFLNQLAVLTGDSVNNTENYERASIDNVVFPKDIPSQIPSEVVLGRPDVSKAEAQLQKSKIDVDVARKDYLPTISITGQFGFYANSMSKVFDWNSAIASVGGSLLQKLYTGGRRKAMIKAKKYKYEQLLESYQKVILTSFQEVNDSLVAYKNDEAKFHEISMQYDLIQDDYNLQKSRYDAGLGSYIDLITTNEKLLLAQKKLTQTKTAELISTISVYKATAGNL
ncbi:MAG: efflux transporter outer membrane subunit [bacterium]